MEQMHYQRCVLSEGFTIDDIENPIPIDISAEEWIKEIEENVRKNKILKKQLFIKRKQERFNRSTYNTNKK